MSHDMLKKVIEENREVFDDAVPSPDIWDRIERQLPPARAGLGNRQAKTIRIWKVTAAAAVALLLMASGVIIGLSSSLAGQQQDEIMAEYAETEKYYATQVNERLSAIQRQYDDPALEEDLKQLDEIYQDLKTELMETDNPNKSEIINAMIINYQTKVAILEKVLERVEEGKLKKENRNENEI